MQTMQPEPAPGHRAPPDLHFEMGGPAYGLMRKIGLIKGAGPSVMRRSVCFVLVTWVPLCVLALLHGHAIGPTPRSSLLLDFATYARLLVSTPLVFAAEAVVGPRIREAGLRFFQGGIVRPESHASFRQAVLRAQRRREAAVPEFAFLLAAILGAWFFSLERIVGIAEAETVVTWRGGPLGTTPAGLWYQVVAVPLIQFFFLRWMWRWIIWSLFLRDVARLRLSLLPTHTDMAAGLGFLGTAQASMSIFPFGASCIVAAELAFRIRFEGLTLAGMQAMLPMLAAYILLAEFVIFGPLLVFVRALATARRDGLRTYGTLVHRHNRMFHEKWIEGAGGEGVSPLGNPDMSSLVDLGSSFAVVRDMNIVPVNRRHLVQVAVVTCLPGLPLALVALPIGEVLKLLVGVVI